MISKYDIDKLSPDTDIDYPSEANDERSCQKRWKEKKTVFCIIQKQKSRLP